MHHPYRNYDERQRREQTPWEPIPLRLPLERPAWPTQAMNHEDEEDEPRGTSKVLIIDLNDYSEIVEDN